MPSPTRNPLIAGAVVTSLGTLSSRVLGLIRDMATAALLGLAGGGLMDALVVANRIANLARSLLGEGALASSYLPAFTAAWQRDRGSAWHLTSVVLARLAVALMALLVLGEATYAAVWFAGADHARLRLLAGLGATLLPYMFFICLAAQLGATLNGLGRFAAPAFAPMLLNVCWLAAVWGVAPWLAPNGEAQAYAIAASIVIAGVLQFAVLLPPLWRLGFRFRYRPADAREPLARIGATLLPMILGTSITQLNTFLDSMIAWGLAATPDGPTMIPWLGGSIPYPLEQGAAAAIYYGERMYWLPLGLIGSAVATSIYPLLSRHAARGDRERLGADLSTGLRLVLALAVPASAALVALAEPLTRLLFERGQFTGDDTLRAARVVAAYGAGVWAYCALPVIVRGYYAIGDSRTPARFAAWMVALNLTLNLTLIWVLAEAGLAAATAICASLQAVWLAVRFSRREIALDWAALAAAAARTIGASAAMIGVARWLLTILPAGEGFRFDLLMALVPLLAGGVTYFAVYWLLGGRWKSG